jgi:hypothetical protein
MLYKTKSGKEVISRTIDKFNIDYSDWIPRSPLWIQDGLSDMDIVLGYEHATETLTVTNYVVMLPCDLKMLDYISYEGSALRNITINKLQYPDQTDEAEGSRYVYVLDRQGYAKFGFTDEDVVINYRRLPVDYDEDYKSWFPRVPDNDMVMEALCWYILKRMMERGHKHPVFSIDTNNSYTNIQRKYDYAKAVAKNRISIPDPAERDEISKLMRSFIQNPNFRNDEFYDNSLYITSTT